MRDLVRFVAPLALLGAFAACKSGQTNPGTGGGGSSSSSSGSMTSSSGSMTSSSGSMTSSSGSTTSSSSSGTPSKGWTIMPLIDDETDPNHKVFRSGNDLVTGIHFASIDNGFVTTTGFNQTAGEGGAVFKAKQHSVDKVLFNGNRDGLCLLGTIDFVGIDKSADGYVALAYACDVIASHDGGKTFDIQSAAAGQFGIERVLAMRARGNDTLMVSESGYLATSTTGPNPSALWDYIWAPEGVPPTPNPVPADECVDGPHGFPPTTSATTYVSPDGQLIAYTASPNFNPQICVSNDGGKSFRPKLLPGVAADALDFVPSGVAFGSAASGVAFWAMSIYPGLAYIHHTSDGGQTWTQVAMPPEIATTSIELKSAFYAPDGTHAWIVGFDYDHSVPLLLRSTDGGATWARSGGDLAAKLTAAGGDKLYTGFALDADHIWVGGNRGLVAASDSGGE